MLGVYNILCNILCRFESGACSEREQWPECDLQFRVSSYFTYILVITIIIIKVKDLKSPWLKCTLLKFNTFRLPISTLFQTFLVYRTPFFFRFFYTKVCSFALYITIYSFFKFNLRLWRSMVTSISIDYRPSSLRLHLYFVFFFYV